MSTSSAGAAIAAAVGSSNIVPEPPLAPPRFAAGSLVRVADICSDRKKNRHGLLPIARRTWLGWVAAGRVPAGVRLGAKTRAWPIELVLEVAKNGIPAAKPQ